MAEIDYTNLTWFDGNLNLLDDKNYSFFDDDVGNETGDLLVPCVCEGGFWSNFWEDFDLFDGDVLEVLLGVVILMGTILGYFIQRNVERKEVKDDEQSRLYDMDRQQALDRVRMQLKVYVGPLHRLYKVQSATMMQYYMSNNIPLVNSGTYWTRMFNDLSIDPILENPHSLRAQHYRSFVENRLRPVYTQARELHLKHASDLADMPSQDEYLAKYGEENCMSPYVGSVNINVIFDTYTTWSYEFDEVIEGWKDGDYTKMQPETRVAWGIGNYIVDYLHDNARKKEAEYNKHVKVHLNEKEAQLDSFELLKNTREMYSSRESVVNASNLSATNQHESDVIT